MKTRRYTITSGAYSDYRILAQVEGSATPALSTLEKRFRKQFNMPVHDNAIPIGYETGYYDSIQEVKSNLKAQGYSDTELEYAVGLLGYFIDWLIKDCGFKLLKSDEYFLDMDW